MLWKSIFAGLRVLTYWETYVAGLEYFAIVFIPLLILAICFPTPTLEQERGKGVGVCLGCLLLPWLQVGAMVVFFLTLSPIILGLARDAAWSLPWVLLFTAPGAFLKLVVIIFVAAIFLALVPILREFNSLYVFVVGAIVLKFSLGILKPDAVGAVDFIPGFWTSLGFLVIGGVMSWVGSIVALILLDAFRKASLRLPIVGSRVVLIHDVGELLGGIIAGIFGFIPAFMYGAWLGMQIR